ncbi:unnamed protein product [Durusdinium trenchii]|uniref:Uncharacterized protein n=1 Tax=Durusdinium trenchii TaxID=1381693 RepID=A0ABP0RWR1_9DINO
MKWTWTWPWKRSRKDQKNFDLEADLRTSSKESSVSENRTTEAATARSPSFRAAETEAAGAEEHCVDLELELHTIARQSSPRHDIERSPGSPSTVRSTGEDHRFDARSRDGSEGRDEGDTEETWHCGLTCCRQMDQISRRRQPASLVSTGVQTDPEPKPKESRTEEFDFSRLVHLAEQRRLQTAIEIKKAEPVKQQGEAKKTRKVFVMPSPDEHYFALEKARREEVRVTSPKSECRSEVESIFLDPKSFYSTRKGDESSRLLLLSLTRT